MALLWYNIHTYISGGLTGCSCKFLIIGVLAGSDPLDKFNGTERKYYISADIETFNYIPDDTTNACTGEAWDDDVVSTSSTL